MTSARAYILVTGIVFALMVLAHIARIVTEGIWLLHEPMIIATTLISLALTAWAIMLLLKRDG